MYKQIDSNKRKSALLIILFIVVILLAGYGFGSYTEGGYIIMPFAFLFSGVSSFVGYYFSDSIILFASGAKEITRGNAKDIYNLVENLCITAGLPVPKIYVINDPAMNAFATGRDPEHASIAMTTGIVEKLEKTELEGVIAHELSHIKNYDIRLSTMIVVFVGIITLLADWFWRLGLFGGSRRDRSSGGQLGGILAIVGLVLLILSPIFTKLIQLAISRKREFLADASGALLTRYPQGLARALNKISQDPNKMIRLNKATAHMYFANPFRNKSVSTLFATHPPVEERIKALGQMANAT